MALFSLMTDVNFSSGGGTVRDARATFDANVDIFNTVVTALNGGTGDLPLCSQGGADAPVYKQLETGGIKDGAVTAAKIAANAVETAQMVNNAVISSKISNDAVGLDKMAHGTAGNIIGYDVNGNPASLPPPISGMGLSNYFQIRHSENYLSAGGGSFPTANDEIAVPWNPTYDYNTVGAGFSNDHLFLLAGTYHMICRRTLYGIGRARLRIKPYITAGNPSLYSLNGQYTTNGVVLEVSGQLTLTEDMYVSVYLLGETARSTNGLGRAHPTAWAADNEYGFWCGWKIG